MFQRCCVTMTLMLMFQVEVGQLTGVMMSDVQKVRAQSDAI
jgi:hypothetical protein